MREQYVTCDADSVCTPSQVFEIGLRCSEPVPDDRLTASQALSALAAALRLLDITYCHAPPVQVRQAGVV